MEEEQDFKVKIFFNRQALVVYLHDSVTLDLFYSKIREACKFNSNQPITIKWIDNEGNGLIMKVIKIRIIRHFFILIIEIFIKLWVYFLNFIFTKF